MTIIRKDIEKQLFVFALFAYAIASYFVMPAIDNTANMDATDTVFSELVAIIFSIPYLLFAPRILLQKRQDKTIILFSIFFIWTIISTFLNYEIKSYIIFTMMPIFPLLISYTYCRRYKIDNVFFATFILSFLLISYRYFQIYQLAHYLSEAHIGVSYFALIVLPLVLLCPSKIIRAVAWVITLVVIVSSIKRGGLFAFLAGVIVYVFCKQLVSKKSIAFSFIILSLTLITLLIGLIYSIDWFESDVIERFNNIKDDGGSGRIDIWQLVIQNISDSDIVSFLSGHGYLSVRILTKSAGLPAHNDFLEIFYDFGVIGIILYAIAWISLIRKTIILLFKKSEFAPILAMLVIIFFILSMLSIVYYYFYIVYICLILGIIIGQSELAFNQEKYK